MTRKNILLTNFQREALGL
uniref:Uncharacterized protein n=1 Tax=Anguilla anguilla TaxID=7936 RepID=A0A0E9XFY1_ANGAN